MAEPRPQHPRAIATGQSLEIRSPGATRPWQHVLESLYGYLLLGQRLMEDRAEFAEAWNFGPDSQGSRSVADVLGGLQNHWPGLCWHTTPAPQPHEAGLLQLDSAKARQRLGWRACWDLEQTLEMTVAWYRAHLESGRVISQEQLAAYCTVLERKSD